MLAQHAMMTVDVLWGLILSSAGLVPTPIWRCKWRNKKLKGFLIVALHEQKRKYWRLACGSPYAIMITEWIIAALLNVWFQLWDNMSQYGKVIYAIYASVLFVRRRMIITYMYHLYIFEIYKYKIIPCTIIYWKMPNNGIILN